VELETWSAKYFCRAGLLKLGAIKDDELNGRHCTHKKNEKWVQNLKQKAGRTRRIVGIHGKAIIKWVWKELCVVWMKTAQHSPASMTVNLLVPHNVGNFMTN
jgi:hypothetical protein